MKIYAIEHSTLEQVKKKQLQPTRNLHYINVHLKEISKRGAVKIGIENTVPANFNYKNTTKGASILENRIARWHISDARYFKGLELRAKRNKLQVVNLESSQDSQRLRQLSADILAIGRKKPLLPRKTLLKYAGELGAILLNPTALAEVYEGVKFARSIEMGKTAIRENLEHIIVAGEHAVNLQLLGQGKSIAVNLPAVPSITLNAAKLRGNAFLKHEALIERLKQLHA